MRALLNLLRAEGNGTAPGRREADLVPVPGQVDLDTSAARTAEAGVRVDLDVRAGAGAHAGAASADDGCPAAGRGIAGMRERVGIYRGEFRAGPGNWFIARHT